ncbi:MAG: MotA/TolQ/ExbB proton channel family protein [Alcanivorax sp.]|nr:MotA/TolQ/ExbB proton channel family protein [Alcanivorax sp.]
MLDALRELLDLGGPVLWLIGAVLVALWALIADRWLYLWRVHPDRRRRALAVWRAVRPPNLWSARKLRARLVSLVAQPLERHLALIRTLIALCPLLGLLGTVTGMLRVFDVLAVIGTGDARALADGVARATVPTMAGMVAALSGVLMSHYLARRARYEREALTDAMTIDAPGGDTHA